ncbi:MAG: ABC transporter permease [Sulfurospirillaceae bacterium]|nr:ABC transporter permease [Sulfurospirillaceae bacterium]MDD2826637.1 ABC transporter permease [Sulfurospirillaceae bacterium]
MKSISSHLSVMLSVFVLLFCLQFANVINKIVDEYADKITNDYSIVIVSSIEIKEEDLKKQISEVTSLSEISSKKILDRLKNDMSSKNLALLQVALPKFYTIKLGVMPNQKNIQEIKTKLGAISSITRIETFAKTHEKIFKMFLILQTTAYVFTTFIALISMLLIFKQVRIWVYEHNRRMSIMSLFGASFFMKSAMLYRMAIVDSVLSALLVSVFYFILPKISMVQAFAESLGITLPQFNIIYEGGALMGGAFLFSIFAVTLVSQKIGRA